MTFSPLFSNTKNKMVQILISISSNMYFYNILKIFLQINNYNNYFFKVSEINKRTIGDNNRTIERFLNFLLLSYERLYAYQVLTF